MKMLSLTFIVLFSQNVFAQKIEIPEGVVYKYCDSITLEKAKNLIKKELTEKPTYSLNPEFLFIGPGIWTRLKNVKAISEIKGGDMTINWYGNQKLKGKALNSLNDFKIVWDNLRSEINNKEFKLRKATVNELKYYWSVISFEIDEPLIVVETAEHNYILDLDASNLKLYWLDEVMTK